MFFGGLTVDAGPEPMYEEKMRVPPPPPGIHVTVNYMIFWYYWLVLKFGWNLYLRIINALCTLAAMDLTRLCRLA